MVGFFDARLLPISDAPPSGGVTMTAFSDFLENELLDHILRNASWTPPTSVWIAAFTAVTGLESNSPSAEVSGGAYARLEVGGGSGRSFTVAASGATTNTETWSFAQATAGWGTVTHVAVMDASTAGNVLFWNALTVAKEITTGDTLTFNAGDFDVALD